MGVTVLVVVMFGVWCLVFGVWCLVFAVLVVLFLLCCSCMANFVVLIFLRF